MATLYCNPGQAFDLLRIDLNFYSRSFYSGSLVKDANALINGVSYRDLVWINGYDGALDLELGLCGTGFAGSLENGISGGTVNAAVSLKRPSLARAVRRGRP